MGRHLATVVLGVVLVVGLLGCGGASDSAPTTTASPPGDAKVELVGLRFSPDTVTVKAGQTVVWVWTDHTIHNIVGPDWKKDNTNGGSFVHRFDTPGRFSYKCTLHPGMTGTVFVTP